MAQHFKIITPVYNGAPWLTQCIESVKSQKHTDFEQIIIDDCSTDCTYETARSAIGGDSRFKIITNSKRQGVPLNQKKGVEEAEADAEDVIVHLDGDDWLYSPDSLDIVNSVYEEKDCWLTYGSYVTTTGEAPVAREYKGHPRQAVLDGWPFSHLRTFKRHLWDYLTEDNFKDSNGDFYTAAADVVIFVPILEKIGYDRVEYIKDILLVYNLSQLYNEHKQNLSEQARVALDVIRK